MDISILSLSHLLPIALSLKDEKGVYQHANAAFISHLKSLGFDEPIIGKTDKDIFDAASATVIAKHDALVLKTGKKEVSDENITVKHGKSTTQLAIRTLYESKGEKGVLTVLFDISAIKAKEIALITAKQEAQASERASRISLNHILRYLPGYVYWKNTDSVYLGCNENFAIAAGLSHMEDIVGKTDYDLAWGKTEAELFRQGDREAFSGRTKYNFEEPQRMADGKQATVLATKVPLKDEQEKIIGVLGIYTDITDRKKAELALMDAKEKAEEAMSEKTEFIRNMSHDLRTPITGIIGMSDILARETKENFTYDAARDVEAAARALLNFFNQVIETAELELGELPDQQNAFSLKNIQKNIIQIFMPAAQQKKIKIESYFDQSIPKVMIGNDAFLYRILLNLVANAVKFTEQGSISIEMTLERHTLQNAVVQISIKDTGKGIPKDKQAKIFEKFNRLTPSYENVHKGSGLGLYIVSQYLQRMGGEIYLESRPGAGSRFTCFIPFKLPLSEQFSKVKPVSYLKTEESAINYAVSSLFPEPTTADDALHIPPAPLSSCHALLVEDNPLALKIGRFNLAQWGYSVTSATNAQDAEMHLNKTRFDIIYLDLGLPDKNGLDLASELKANVKALNHATPVIALTAHADEQSKQACLKAGVSEMLSKPLTETDGRRLCAKAAQQANELPVIDWGLWYNRCQHHESLIEEALRTVLRDLPLFEQQMSDALAQENIQSMRDTLHTCLGMLRFCALPRLEKAVEVLHDIARKKPENIPAAFKDFQVQSKAALDAIQSLSA
ncbi:MAG: ATP-binding protein [Gammaproteobacteria bacterium]